MSTFLLLCPTHRDLREIDRLGLKKQHQFLTHDYASIALEELVMPSPPSGITINDIEDEINLILDRFGKLDIDGVISTDDYPGSTLATIIAKQLKLPGVSPRANLLCQHKYYARCLQKEVAPQATPDFELIDHSHPHCDLPTPFFIKPVKSFFSVGAYAIRKKEDLINLAANAALPKEFFIPFRKVFGKYTEQAFGDYTCLAESLLEGVQATLEGYVYGGKVEILGVVDSIMYPGTRAFQRFDYPSHLPDSVQNRMTQITQAIMAAMKFDNGLFNIEFMYNPARDSLHIIEINPRMASQFADIYEKVDGVNSYRVLLDLALGRKPQIKKRAGLHKFAASCVLRTFADQKVVKLPTQDEIARIQARYPDIRIEALATEGKMLSQEMQDSQSYRYGIISIGGRDQQDVLQILDYCMSQLSFQFDQDLLAMKAA